MFKNVDLIPSVKNRISRTKTLQKENQIGKKILNICLVSHFLTDFKEPLFRERPLYKLFLQKTIVIVFSFKELVWITFPDWDRRSIESSTFITI